MGERRSIRSCRGALVAVAPLLMLACGAGNGPANHPEAPVEAGRSVENPALLRAIAARDPDRPIQQQVELVLQLNAATYLLPTSAGPGAGGGAAPGGQEGPAGESFGLLTITDENGGRWLPLFTDSRSLRAWTTQEVRIHVWDARKAWTLALSGRYLVGAIINPGGEGIRLNRATLHLLRRLFEGAPPATREDP